MEDIIKEAQDNWEKFCVDSVEKKNRKPRIDEHDKWIAEWIEKAYKAGQEVWEKSMKR